MASTQANIDKFVGLLQGRKIKQLKTYLDRIANFDTSAQIIVTKGLERCLVHKKTTPMGVATALFIYKQLLIRSQFDFLESESFNQKIHQFVYDVCLHRPSASLEERGKTYFVDTMKLPANKQTEELGNTVIQLASQIVQEMALWYPLDYFTNTDSRYAIYYKKLKEKKVEFPNKENYYFMKPEDSKKFIENHKKWIIKMDELYDEQEEQMPPQKNKDNATKQTKQITQSQPPKTQTEPSKSNTTNANKTGNANNNLGKQPPKSALNTNTIKSTIQSNKNNLQVKKQIKSELKQDKTKSVTIKEDKNIQNAVNEGSKKQISPQFILQNTNKVVTNNKPEIQKAIPQTVSYGNNASNKANTNTNTNNIISTNTNNTSNINPSKMQRPIKDMEERANTSPFKHNVVQRRTQSNNFYKNNQNQSPSKTTGQISRKILKTEKNFWEPHQQQQNIATFRKSLPKTENKNNFNNIQLLNSPFKLLSTEQKQSFITGNTKQTLSDFRQAKYKMRSGQLPNQVANKSLLEIINKTKLGEVLIPFLPQYFQPVDLGMQALILQSLRVGSHPTLESSKPFYKNQQLAIRLIKSQGSYILSIHNVGLNTFQIGYSQALQAKFGNQFSSLIRVKSLGRRNLQEIKTWRADPNDFIDIPFSFQTKDPNFKFLQFVILFNNKNLPLNLPITILDQGVIEKNLYLQDIDSYINLYGRIFKSTPISLSLNDSHQHYEILPSFFQKSRLKDCQMLGHLTYTIEIDPSTIVRVTVFVKQIIQNPSQCQIHALYDNRLPLNEDYAKVLIQVLCFLLSKHH